MGFSVGVGVKHYFVVHLNFENNNFMSQQPYRHNYYTKFGPAVKSL